MASDDFPEIRVWTPIGGGEYALSGSISVYDSLTFEPRYLEAGTWEATMPYNQVSQGVTAAKLYTIDFRGARTTWCLDKFNPASNAQGGTDLTIGGPSALSILGWELAWPNPTLDLDNQPEPPPLVTGAPAAAETVVRSLVTANFVTRRGGNLVVAASSGDGLTIRAKPKFDNLLELVTRKARKGEIGIDVNLVDSSSTRADLTFQTWAIADRDLSDRVRLSAKVGNLVGWSQNNTAPTVTTALTSGPDTGSGRIYLEVDTADSIDAAADWGGHRVTLVDGPASYDDNDLTEAGEEALKEGASTTNVEFEAADTAGLQAFRHFNVGDTVTGELETGLAVTDVISSINVTISEGYPEITPKFGNPDAEEPMVEMGQLVRHLTRRIRLLEQRS